MKREERQRRRWDREGKKRREERRERGVERREGRKRERRGKERKGEGREGKERGVAMPNVLYPEIVPKPRPTTCTRLESTLKYVPSQSCY